VRHAVQEVAVSLCNVNLTYVNYIAGHDLKPKMMCMACSVIAGYRPLQAGCA
jgi:hypothetical protein